MRTFDAVLGLVTRWWPSRTDQLAVEMREICTMATFLFETGPNPSQHEQQRALLKKMRQWVDTGKLRDLHLIR